MSAIVLANSTGNDEVDRVLRLTIDALETTLPGLFRGYYVLGSHASGTALPTSDLDLAFEGHAGDDVQAAGRYGRKFLTQAAKLLIPHICCTPALGTITQQHI